MNKFKTSVLCCAFLFSLIAQAQANIVLRVMAINPSEEESQVVSVKAYLPKETKPEDVINSGNLAVAYDPQQGSYFVYGDYELKPGETAEEEIELKDIWITPVSEIESLRAESDKITGMLKNTSFSERVNFLKNSIDSKLNQIIESEKNPPANPEQHISEYRDNLRILESVKADVALARSLMAQAKPSQLHVVIWRLVVAIILFLGLLGLGFYFVWHKQIKNIINEDVIPIINKEAPKN